LMVGIGNLFPFEVTLSFREEAQAQEGAGRNRPRGRRSYTRKMDTGHWLLRGA
jgi:hypothetical protein